MPRNNIKSAFIFKLLRGCGINKSTFYERIRRGWDFPKTMLQPVGSENKRYYGSSKKKYSLSGLMNRIERGRKWEYENSIELFNPCPEVGEGSSINWNLETQMNFNNHSRIFNLVYGRKQ